MVSVVLPSDASPLVVAVGAAAAAAVAYRLVYRALSSAAASPAPAQRLPQSHWLLGDLPALLANAARFNDWVLDQTRACGERPWLRHAPLLADMVIVATPAAVEDVARTQHDAFGKGDFTRELLRELTGDSFFSLDGAAWLHQRKIATKFFSARMYREVATPIIHAHVARTVATLGAACDAQRPVNLTELLNAFALQTFAELGFGLQIERVDARPLDRALDEAFAHVFRRLQLPTWAWKAQRWLDVGEERKFKETTQFVRQFVSQLVSQSLARSATAESATTEAAATMVELFIDAMREGQGEISPELLCDIAIMFVLGGRDTTTDTLNWFFFSLARHPEIERQLRDELWDKAPELMEGTTAVLGMEQAQSLVLLEAAIKETLRLFPAATLSPRQALRDAVLADGTFIPKGMHMGISAYAMGRLTSVWGDDASEFKPQRFVDRKTGKLRAVSPFQFFGFGAGPRSCIGMNLAMLEMKLLLSTLLSRFTFDVAPNDGRYKFSANLTLHAPLRARVARRLSTRVGGRPPSRP